MVYRCWGDKDELMREYHDTEWGVPLHDDYKLFEFLVLDGAQAGLSWSTILNKRENYRKAFDNFDFEKIAKYGDDKIEELLSNPGIIRNTLKVKAFITNAQAYIKLRKEFGSFDKYIWDYVDNKPIQNKLDGFEGMPSKTILSEIITKDLKKRGFKFVGPTIVYAFMQAIGLVNDHLGKCFRYDEIRKLSS
ncbi:MAG: DNA-3-methyladenine glycosylase I [Promethearchaeota archaeon]